MFKRTALIIVAFAMVLTAGLGAIWLWGQFAPSVEAQSVEASELSPAQTITVVGTGSASVEPDIARTSIGVETYGETVAEAVDANSELMTSILTALEAAGIDGKDIQTSGYSINMERYPEPQPRVISTEEGDEGNQPQYRVSNMLNVTIRDLDSVSDVLDAAIEAGANSIWGVNFALEDMSEAQAGAREDAVADAASRASALAELGGVELGPIMSISEVIGGGAVPMAVTVEKAVASGAGPISPGELEVSYQVQVVYFVVP
jgi:uncharacterized protein YggE